MLAIQRQPVRLRQAGAVRPRSITAEFPGTVARQPGDDSGGAIDPPHASVQPIGHVNIAGAVDDNSVRLVHPRLCRWSAIAGEAAFTIARNRADDAGTSIDPPHA